MRCGSAHAAIPGRFAIHVRLAVFISQSAEVFEEMLQAGRRHAHQQQAGLCTDVSKGVDVIARQKDERSRRRIDELFAELELKLPL
jgi:hypothetical protein